MSIELFLGHYSAIGSVSRGHQCAYSCGPWTAVAGHGDDNVNLAVPVVEAIHARAARIEHSVVQSDCYCGLHYLIGPAAVAEGLPGALSMVDRSVYVRGHWSTKINPVGQVVFRAATAR